MKAPALFGDTTLTVYALELCFYGERGDYEVFADRELGLDLAAIRGQCEARRWAVAETGPELLIFRDLEGTEYTLYPDGRMIIESLKPGSARQAWSRACEILGFEAVA